MRWQELPQTGQLPGPRSSHAIAAVGDKVYLFGGEQQPRVPLPADLYCYDTCSGNWSIVPSSSCCPGPRVAATMAAVGDSVYLYGGRTGIDMTEGAKSDLYVFDTAKNEWQSVPTDPSKPQPPPRSYHAMTACPTDQKLYVFGGCGSSGRLNDLWCFDISSSSWQQLGCNRSSSEQVAARGGSVLVAAADGKQLFLMGGFNGVEMQDCHVFDVTSNTWCCPTCCSSGSNAASTAAADAAGQPGSGSSGLTLPFGRSVFGAALHGGSSSSGAGGECGCDHAHHVVTFGGEVSPSDKGHAGAGNFTDVLQCLAPTDPATADLHNSSSRWHSLQAAGPGPGPRGWFAATAAAGGSMLVHGGLGADNARRGDMFMLCMHE